jgi:SAM-dependent methyltransferase
VEGHIVSIENLKYIEAIKLYHMSTIQDVYTFWNNRPCNVRHSSKSSDCVEFFDEVAAKRYRAEPHILSFLALETWKGKRVLELGCGMGTDAIQFAKAGAHVVCVDLTENSLDLCRKNFALHDLSGEFYIGNIEDLSNVLPSEYIGSFDLIYSFGVIHHTPCPSNVFKQIPHFLKDGGEFRCMLYSRFSYKLFWLMNEYQTWSFQHADLLVQKYSEAQSGCPVTYTFTFDEIQELVSPHLEIQTIWKDHIFIWNIEKYKMGQFEHDTPFQNVSDQYLRQMKKELGWHTLFISKKST